MVWWWLLSWSWLLYQHKHPFLPIFVFYARTLKCLPRPRLRAADRGPHDASIECDFPGSRHSSCSSGRALGGRGVPPDTRLCAPHPAVWRHVCYFGDVLFGRGGAAVRRPAGGAAARRDGAAEEGALPHGWFLMCDGGGGAAEEGALLHGWFLICDV